MSADRLSAAELARLAEVDPGFVDRAVNAGALGRPAAADAGTRCPPASSEAFTARDATRLRFLHAWDAAGLPVEHIGDLIRRGELAFSFLGGPATDAPPRLPATHGELCAAHGVDLEALRRLYDTLGFTPPAADERAREDDLPLVELLGVTAAADLDEAALVRLLRLYAELTRRVAQAEEELFRSQVEARLRRTGATEQDLLDQGGAFGTRLPPVFERALVAVYRRHRQHVWLDHSIGHVERIMEANGLYQRLDRPPCVCFVDLTGYTRLVAEHGDEVAAELAGRLAMLVERICRRWDGRPVRWLGDGGMLVFRSATASVHAAVEMVTEAPAHGLPPTHIGIHCGPVVFQDGDIYGTTVNIAARLSARAQPGEVLVSGQVADQVTEPGLLEPLGPARLKGVDRPVALHRARVRHEGAGSGHA